MFHEAAFYSSEDELLNIAVPFLEASLETGAPSMVVLNERDSELIRSVIPDTSQLSFLRDPYLRPASVIKSVQQVLTGQMFDGTEQIRILGEVPHPGMGMPWEWWARYEATINHAFDQSPLWVLCLYDLRITSGDVLNDVTQTHPYLMTADGRRTVNNRYLCPEVFLTRARPTYPDPLEAASPLVDLVDPMPLAARQAVREAGASTRLPVADVEGLVIAVCEALTNSICHGRPPVQLRLWANPDRVVVTVTDRGGGPADPFAGLLPAATGPPGGLGLWLAHQLCSLVTLDKTKDTFTVRLVAGQPASCHPDVRVA
ncbi:MAG: sensor histidine kinase [Pseudonocardiales bacterium]|nr:sensor histidine kinase [Pseudonocardiales bacterium]